MGIFSKLGDWVVGNNNLQTRATPAPYKSYAGAYGASAMSGVLPPSRSNPTGDLNVSLSLDSVYRAIDIIVTNVAQLELVAYKQGKPTSNALVRKPDINQTLSSFLKRTTINLAGTGNAYWLITRDVETSVVMNLEVLNPLAISIAYDKGRKTYHYGDQVFTDDQVKHLRKLEVPGSVLGLGPIQAGAYSIRGVQDVSAYGNNFFRDGAAPNGILSSDQYLSGDEAQEMKDRWIAQQQERSVAVLGKGLSYSPVILNPADAQWIESQQFNIKTIARWFGIPYTWLGSELGGNSMTYNNQESVWIEYVRNTLMAYLVEIESAFTELTPNGTTVKFNVDGLLRPDSNTRATIHATELSAGYKTVSEVRAEEGLLPFTAAQKRELEASKPAPSAPQQEDTNE